MSSAVKSASAAGVTARARASVGDASGVANVKGGVTGNGAATASGANASKVNSAVSVSRITPCKGGGRRNRQNAGASRNG